MRSRHTCSIEISNRDDDDGDNANTDDGKPLILVIMMTVSLKLFFLSQILKSLCQITNTDILRRIEYFIHEVSILTI